MAGTLPDPRLFIPGGFMAYGSPQEALQAVATGEVRGENPESRKWCEIFKQWHFDKAASAHAQENLDNLREYRRQQESMYPFQREADRTIPDWQAEQNAERKRQEQWKETNFQLGIQAAREQKYHEQKIREEQARAAERERQEAQERKNAYIAQRNQARIERERIKQETIDRRAAERRAQEEQDAHYAKMGEGMIQESHRQGVFSRFINWLSTSPEPKDEKAGRK